LQRGHCPQFGHPLFCSLSAIQSLFCKANQAWFFILGGAQAFQIILSIEECTSPRNCIWYAKAVE
jgi:hypothetical protein